MLFIRFNSLERFAVQTVAANNSFRPTQTFSSPCLSLYRQNTIEFFASMKLFQTLRCDFVHERPVKANLRPTKIRCAVMYAKLSFAVVACYSFTVENATPLRCNSSSRRYITDNVPDAVLSSINSKVAITWPVSVNTNSVMSVEPTGIEITTILMMKTAK